MAEPHPSHESVDPRPDDADTRRQAADDLLANVVCALLVIGSLAFALFRLGDGERTRLDLLPSGRVLNVDRATFLAASIATGTGMPMSIVSPSDLPTAGRVTVALLSLAATGYFLATALCLLAHGVGVRLGFWRALQWTFASALIGATVARVAGADSYDALTSATRLGWPVDPSTNASESVLLLGLLPAAIIGLLGPLLWGAIRVPALRRPWLGTIAAVCGLTLVGTLLLVILERDAPAELAPRAVALAASATALGQPTVPLGNLAPASQALLVWLMLLGGLSAVALRSLASSTTRRIGLLWIVGIALLLAVGSVTLLTTSPETPIDRATFLTASALAAIGLSHDPVGLAPAAMYVLVGLMLVGRFWTLFMLWLIARSRCDTGAKDAEKEAEDRKPLNA